MNKLVFFIIALIFISCSTKLKIYDSCQLTKNNDKNFYYKDTEYSYEILKGTWIWTNEKDTLYVKATPIYKKPIKKFKNSFYDVGALSLKYIKNGKVIYDGLNDNLEKSCLLADKTTTNNRNMFILTNSCSTYLYSYLLFMRGAQSLALLSPLVDKNKILLKTEDGTEIVIPNSIILDRVVN